MSTSKRLEELLEEAEKTSRELFATRERLKELKEKLDVLRQEASRLRNEKLKLLQEIRSLKNQMRVLKDERDKLIEEYRRVIKELNENLSQAKLIKELIDSKLARSHKLSREVKVPIGFLKQKIDEIEWTIQTKTLSLEEENELIRKLKTYTSLYNKAVAAKKSEEEALELRALYLSTRAKIGELLSRRNKLRDTIKEKINAINELKNKLNTVVSSYIEVKSGLEGKKKEIAKLVDEIAVLTSKLNALREKYQELLRDIEKARSLEVISRKRAEVLQDVESRRRKRVTIDELKIMYGELDELEGR